MLVVADAVSPSKRTADPVVGAFLSFLARDMAKRPQQIRPLDRDLTQRVDALVKGVAVNPDEDLGDEPLL
jgi:antitoxin PrlF